MKCENCPKWYETPKKGSSDPCKDCPIIKGLKKGKATVTVKLRTTGKTYKVNVKVK